MAKLMVESREIQSAIVPVRWCLTKEDLEKLEKSGALNPHILLVIRSGERESRYLAPLNQMMEYLQFSRPGPSQIFATIIWCKSGKPSELRDDYLRRRDGEYTTDVLNSDGTDFVGWIRRRDGAYHYNLVLDPLELVLPQELFAKEPPEWEKRWVNLWFETKPRDECQYRGRRILAYTIQPPAVLLWLIMVLSWRWLAAAWHLLLLARRGVNLKPLVHPWRYQSQDIWIGAGDPIFWHEVGERGAELPLFFFLPFVPIVPLGILLAFMVAWPYDQTLWVLKLAAAVFGCLVVLMALVTLCFAFFPALLDKWEEKQKAKWREAQPDYEGLLCNGCAQVSLQALPPQRQTIYLQFQDFKAKVCQPFAR